MLAADGSWGHRSKAPSFFFSSRRRHTRYWRDWSSDVCSSDLRCTRWRLRRSDTSMAHTSVAFLLPKHAFSDFLGFREDCLPETTHDGNGTDKLCQGSRDRDPVPCG